MKISQMLSKNLESWSWDLEKNFAMTVMIICLDKFSSTHRKEWSLCPYHGQKKIEKEEEEKKRIINDDSDEYKYPGNDHIP